MKEYIVTIVRYDGSDKQKVRIMAYSASTAMYEAESTYQGFIAKGAKASSKTKTGNPLFGFLTSRKKPFEQKSRGKITYHRDLKAERKEKARKLRGLTTAQKKIVSRAMATTDTKNKELLPLFELNPSRFKKGIKGTVKLVGKGKRARLEIYT